MRLSITLGFLAFFASLALTRNTYIQRCGNADLIPGSKALAKLEASLLTEMGTERFLREILSPLRPHYDYTIIDTNRAASPLMTNALTAADSVLIPLCPEFYSTEGLVLLVERHDAQLPPRSQVIRRWLGRLGPEAFFQLLEVKRADSMEQDLEKVRDRLVELDEIKAKAEQILAEGQYFTLKDLAVDGRDVMAAGSHRARRWGGCWADCWSGCSAGDTQ